MPLFDYYVPHFLRKGMKMRPILSLLVILIIIAGSQFSPTTRAVDAAGLLLEWEGPPYRLTTVLGDDGQTYTQVEVEGYVNAGPPGWPSLPSLGRLVALPPSGDFGLELIQVVYDSVPLADPIEPSPGLAPPQMDASGEPLPRETVFTRDEAAYTSTAPFPAAPVTLGDAVWMRDHRLARLTFTPFRYHPTRGTLEVVRRVRFRVWWQPPTAPAPTALTEDPFNDPLAGLVLNPAELDIFRASRTSASQSIDQTTPQKAALTSHPSKVLVATEGIYALDYATLVAAALPVESIDPATLRLTHDGIEVDAQWEGDDDNAFEAGERLLFYARPQLTRYAGYDVFWLSWGDGTGERMDERPGSPSGLPQGTAWATAQIAENA
ncbi:MAG: hypothetical protein JSV36_06025 [Anaerolineae bacterium]|nr:MAG: hypothetical protein JSV36_06025 [Anaerolineae bacterium]